MAAFGLVAHARPPGYNPYYHPLESSDPARDPSLGDHKPSCYPTQVPDEKAAHSTASKAFRKLIRECLQNHESITFNGLSPAGSKVNKAHYTYFILTSAAQTALATAAQELLIQHE